MTNPYISVQHQAKGWYWRIECVEGYYPWIGPFTNEEAARQDGKRTLRDLNHQRSNHQCVSS